MQDYSVVIDSARTQTITKRQENAKGRLNLERYMGWGKKMFPDTDAQDYIRELRDSDRTF